jgi:uncharacterized protein (DUF1499 family)
MRSPQLGRARAEQRRRARISLALKWLKRLDVITGALATIGLVVVLALMMSWPPINHVVAGQTAEYPDVQPVAWSQSQARAFYAVREVIAAEDDWTEVRVDEGSGLVEFEATSRTGLFTDDVSVRVEANGEGGSIVFAESASRMGRSDFGQNASTLRRLYTALESNIGAPHTP